MIDQYPPANGVLTSLIWRKTAAGGETSLSGYDNASQALSYTPGQEQVYLNGILLVRGSDYTATNGTSITSLTALAVDDFVQINCYNNFSVASLPTSGLVGEISNSQITSLATTKLTGTITNAQLAGSISNDKLTNSSITINGSPVALGGSVSLPGDIESVTAGTGLSGGGSSGSVTLSIDSTVTTLTGSQDLTNKTLTSPGITGGTLINTVIRGLEEDVNVVASAATGTINFDVETASIWYYTSNASANHTLNFRYNSSTSLNTALAVGDAITLVWLNTNGATPYYPNTIQIDGNSVTPKVPAAISAGNASAIDAYSFTIIKTASATFTVLETQTKFA